MDQMPANRAFAPQYYDIALAMERQGSRIGADRSEALKWLEQSASLDFPPAQFRLGKIYFEGKTILRDYVLALKWFEKSSQNGHIEAAYYLGIMFSRGLGTAPDMEKAMDYLKQAARQGSSEAMFMLGNIYYLGKGTAKSYAHAAFWYGKAADHGHELSKKELTKQISLNELRLSADGNIDLSADRARAESEMPLYD